MTRLLIQAAAARGGDFGVITLGPQLVERKRRQERELGLAVVEPVEAGIREAVPASAPVA